MGQNRTNLVHSQPDPPPHTAPDVTSRDVPCRRLAGREFRGI